jgi:ferredoxin
LVRHLKNAKKSIVKKIKTKKKLINKDIMKHFHNRIWETPASKCVSCGACTILCPTCSCFDISDEVELNIGNGTRVKKETSCQLKSFTLVAGGKSFRENRVDRYKHFVYHKAAYFKERFNKYLCVGCGRCILGCPARIDWVETCNMLKEAEVMKK